MSAESVSMYPRRPKAEVFSNAVDVVERLRDPTDPSTKRIVGLCSNFKKILRTRKIMVMHSNEREECVYVPS